jgi:hypothetical protein
MRAHGRRLAVASVAVLGVALPAAARGAPPNTTKQACVAASTDGQALRDAGKLREAREKLVACARDECPAIVRKYCSEWLADVEKRLPSVVFRVQAAEGSSGADVTDATVTVDAGTPHPVDGSATPVDPGEHVVRFEHPGDPPVEMHVVVSEGEKSRIVTGRFAPKAAPPPEETRPEPERPEPVKAGISPLAIALAGVAVVGGAGFAYFGITAKNDLDHLRQTCAPYCRSSDLDAVRQKALFADLSLGVGVVALGAATWVFLASSHRDAEPPAATERGASLDVQPIRGGAFAGVSGRF